MGTWLISLESQILKAGLGVIEVPPETVGGGLEVLKQSVVGDRRKEICRGSLYYLWIHVGMIQGRLGGGDVWKFDLFKTRRF